jgi:hypothetical protein
MTLPVVDGNGDPTALASDYAAGAHTTHSKVTSLPGTVASDITATKTATEATSTKLDTLAASLTTLQGYVDGLETLVGSTNTKVDAVTAAIVALQALVDGLEGLVGTTNTALGNVDGHVDGLEGFLSTLAGTVIATKVQTEVATLPAPNSAGPFTTQSNVGSTATQLTSQACKHGVWLRNLHATQTLAYGNDNTVTTSAGYLLRPGEEKFLPVANRSQIWIYGSGASTTYCTSAS